LTIKQFNATLREHFTNKRDFNMYKLLKFLIVVNLLIFIMATATYIYLNQKLNNYENNIIGPDMSKYISNEGRGKIFTEFDIE